MAGWNAVRLNRSNSQDHPVPDASVVLPLLNALTAAALVIGAFNPESRRYVNLIARSYGERSRGARGLIVIALATVGHILVTGALGSFAAIVAWLIGTWNRPVLVVVTAAACLGSGVSEIVMASYRRWRPHRTVPTTAGALYGFVLSPCRAALILYFACVSSNWRAFPLLSTVFGGATIAMVLLQASLVLVGHGNRYFFGKENACRVIVGVLLCFLSLIVVSAA